MPDLETLKQAPASLGLTDLIAARWSPRSFTDQPVSTGDLTRILTAAGWAASSSNEQPWRFLVGRKGDETYAKIFDALIDFNRNWATTAPVLILSAAAKTFAKNGSPNLWALHDTGAASATFCLQAIALGIHTHGMAGFDQAKARANFAIPDAFDLGAIWALGYLGDPNVLPEPYKSTETSPRTRKPLDSYVFSAWDQPAIL